MANGNATFTEVLEIKVLTDQFANEMKKVEQIYADTIKRMPQIGNVGAASFAASIQQLNQTIQQLQTGGTQAVQALAQNMLQTANIVQTQMQQMGNQVTGALAKVRAAMNQTGQAGAASAAAATSGWGKFYQSLTGNIPGTIGALVRIKLAWLAINEAITLVGNVVFAPFRAVQDGIKYLEDFQDRSSVIKSALLQSVSFSADWGTNVKLAGQEADNLVRKIDTLATQLRVKSQIIQAGFATFLEFGGRNLTKSLDDALQISALATAALQSQNPNIQTRKVATEIQQLVSGTLTNTSKLAAAFQVSADELNKMSVHARTTHDLLGALAEKTPGLTQRIIEANARFGSLSDALELYKRRWEALLAGPLFDRFIRFLQESLDWLDKHNDQVQAVGRAWGQVVDQFGKVLADFVKLRADDLKTFFQFLATALTISAASAAAMVNSILTLISLASKANLANLFGDPEKDLQKTLERQQSNPPTSDKERKFYDDKIAELKREIEAKKEVDRILAAHAAQGDSITESATKAIALINGIMAAPGAPKDTEPANTPTHGILGEKPDLSKVMEDFDSEYQQLKNKYQDLRDQEAEAVTARKVSHAQAAQFIAESYDQENRELSKLLKTYRDMVNTSEGDDKAKKSALKRLQRAEDSSDGSFTHAQNLADKAATAENVQKQKDAFKAQLELEKQNNQAELALDQERQKEGYLTEVEFLDKKTAANKRAHEINVQLINDEIASYGTDTIEYQKAVEALTLENQRYTNQVKLESAERQAAVEREQQQLRQFAIDQAKIAVNAAELRVQVAQSGGVFAQQAAQRALLDAKKKEIDLTILATEAELALQRSKNGETEATRKLEIELKNLAIQRAQVAGERAGVGINPIIRDRVQQRAQDAQAQQAIADMQAAMAAWKNAKQQEGETDEEFRQRLQDLQEAAEQAKEQVEALGDAMPAAKEGVGDFTQKLLDAFSGGDFFSSMKAAQGGVEKFAVALDGAVNFIKAIQGLFNAYEQGRRQGGVLGGIGAVGSQIGGFVSQFNPLVGGIIQGVSSALSLIGGLFTSAAKKIANQIKGEIDTIIKSYNAGTATLGATITALEKEREDAIRKLAGKKGGSKELSQLLPSLDDQIQQLKKQQADVFNNFNNQLVLLRQSDDTLHSFLQSWMDINKQVKDYLDAGGNIAEAQEFLSRSLLKLRDDAAKSLREEEQSAVQDALKLNDLLKQRQQLIDDEKKQEFDLLNKDAIERRGSNAIATGQQIQQLRKQLNDQLTDLDSQIRVQTYKVDKEKELFKLTSDISDLHRLDEQLQEQAIDDQLKKVASLQMILAGIHDYGDGRVTITQDLYKALAIAGVPLPAVGGIFGAPATTPPKNPFPRFPGIGRGNLGAGAGLAFGGFPGSLDGFLPMSTDMSTSVVIQKLEVNNNGTDPVDGAQLVDAMSAELIRRGRYGLGNRASRLQA